MEAFGWGCAGSASLEVVQFCRAVRGSKNGRLPPLYRTKVFIVGRVLLIIVAGVLAAAWGISQPIQGLALGAAAPRLMLGLERLRLGLPTEEE